ncbi:ribonuclease T2 family protein [Alteriqipengyuania lutimaris]|uniref:Ribonuclease T n=1 Tax=Alteriqipengyuania lutimaris TaxID=1538146 RepID=A0A395LMV4_9SPHN|nr:ribonuclease T [Alteriqipengyuania lutimaris]MBB3034267.1 ribonuclease T2 [Alteriqipengyuania lutimaris]RDS76824.1 ribonuclease T [Alteriqipengyuania lutimaris]
MRRAAGMLAWIAATLPAAAVAQSYQCDLPRNVSVPGVTRDGPTRTMPVAGYILSLSWSPEFCRTRTESPRHARQCSGRWGSFGLIVHGLWPQGARSWPQWCSARRARPTGAQLARQMCVQPSARLAMRQWAKHGSCMADRPDLYFRITRILNRSLDWPDLDRLSREDDLTAGRIREAWIAANTNWRREMISVQLNERGWLEEIRLCYGRDWLPAACERSARGASDETPAKIWRGL